MGLALLLSSGWKQLGFPVGDENENNKAIIETISVDASTNTGLQPSCDATPVSLSSGESLIAPVVEEGDSVSQFASYLGLYDTVNAEDLAYSLKISSSGITDPSIDVYYRERDANTNEWPLSWKKKSLVGANPDFIFKDIFGSLNSSSSYQYKLRTCFIENDRCTMFSDSSSFIVLPKPSLKIALAGVSPSIKISAEDVEASEWVAIHNAAKISPDDGTNVTGEVYYDVRKRYYDGTDDHDISMPVLDRTLNLGENAKDWDNADLENNVQDSEYCTDSSGEKHDKSVCYKARLCLKNPAEITATETTICSEWSDINVDSALIEDLPQPSVSQPADFEIIDPEDNITPVRAGWGAPLAVNLGDISISYKEAGMNAYCIQERSCQVESGEDSCAFKADAWPNEWSCSSFMYVEDYDSNDGLSLPSRYVDKLSYAKYEYRLRVCEAEETDANYCTVGGVSTGWSASSVPYYSLPLPSSSLSDINPDILHLDFVRSDSANDPELYSQDNSYEVYPSDFSKDPSLYKLSYDAEITWRNFGVITTNGYALNALNDLLSDNSLYIQLREFDNANPETGAVAIEEWIFNYNTDFISSSDPHELQKASFASLDLGGDYNRAAGNISYYKLRVCGADPSNANNKEGTYNCSAYTPLKNVHWFDPEIRNLGTSTGSSVVYRDEYEIVWDAVEFKQIGSVTYTLEESSDYGQSWVERCSELSSPVCVLSNPLDGVYYYRVRACYPGMDCTAVADKDKGWTEMTEPVSVNIIYQPGIEISKADGADGGGLALSLSGDYDLKWDYNNLANSYLIQVCEIPSHSNFVSTCSNSSSWQDLVFLGKWSNQISCGTDGAYCNYSIKDQINGNYYYRVKACIDTADYCSEENIVEVSGLYVKNLASEDSTAENSIDNPYLVKDYSDLLFLGYAITKHFALTDNIKIPVASGYGWSTVAPDATFSFLWESGWQGLLYIIR